MYRCIRDVAKHRESVWKGECVSDSVCMGVDTTPDGSSLGTCTDEEGLRHDERGPQQASTGHREAGN